MKSLRDLRVQNRCKDCDKPNRSFLCKVSDENLKLFESIKVTKVYPKGTLLFLEGQPSDAVFMLCQGKVKLSTCSSEGKIIILDVVEPGDVIGLSAALTGAEYEATAEVLELCQVNYVGTGDLIKFLQANPEASLNAARQLSRNYFTAYRQVCSLGLSDSVVDKLARLFLDWFLSLPGQKALEEGLFLHSMRNDAPGPAGGIPISKIKLLLPDDWQAFLKSRTEFQREWDKMTGLR